MNAKKQKKRSLGKILGRILIWTCLLSFLGILILGYSVKKSFDSKLPNDFFTMNIIGEAPHFYTYDFTDRSNRIGTPTELTVEGFEAQKNAYLAYPDIPKSLIDAFVAIEDKRFYEHNGVDWYRTAAAFFNYFLKGKNHFGASTITQQLVKNMTGNDKISASRKIQEIFYALELERTLDKSQILEMYLNIIHFSDSCNGIVQASRHYYGKEPRELSVAEAASIAAITNNPAYYNPIRHPENNLKRRNLILEQMLEQGYLSKEEHDAAIREPIQLNVVDTDQGNQINSWYVDMAIEDVIEDLMREYSLTRGAASSLVFRGGVRIDLAMDPTVQGIVEDYYENVVITPINQNGKRAQSALILIDSHTGDILGVAGAVGDKTGNRIQNFATQTKRPPGSVIKPISVYAPALEEGVINWASVYDDVPVDFGSSGTQPWPKNANGIYRGLTNIPYAVAHSTNTVSVRVLKDLGIEKAYTYAKNRFHLSSMVEKDRDLAALALGQLNYGVTLREITSAYTAFADSGTYHPWKSYYRVIASDGRILLSRDDSAEIALSEGNAAIMTKLLQGVVESGTSSDITLNRLVECAGKTGTTNADADRWFVGYTPDFVCGVWCGYDYPEPLAGKNPCTGIWNAVMCDVTEVKGGEKQFPTPSNLIRASYCKDSGKLLTEICQLDPRKNREEIGWFLKDQLPTQACDRHVACAYDKETNGVSHSFCPYTEQFALIRVERKFPTQIVVGDAEYVYREDPMDIPPNLNSNEPYFAQKYRDFCGISNKKSPFNASCQVHGARPYFQDPHTVYPRE